MMETLLITNKNMDNSNLNYTSKVSSFSKSNILLLSLTNVM